MINPNFYFQSHQTFGSSQMVVGGGGGNRSEIAGSRINVSQSAIYRQVLPPSLTHENLHI
jgi:hypothetical protein